MEKPLFKNRHYNTPGHAHELTYSCYKRSPYFNDPLACRIFLDCIRRSQLKFNFHVWAYVIMPNHVHLLVWLLEQDYSIDMMPTLSCLQPVEISGKFAYSKRVVESVFSWNVSVKLTF